MITFTQMKQQAADNCGLYVDAPEMGKITRDINTGVKLFQNAARRYWTRAEKKTNLVANQQYYQYSSDMLRVTTVKVKSGDHYLPLRQVRSEEEWNRANSNQTVGMGVPTHFFVKGSDEIGLAPVPSANVADGLMVSYEPRMVDMMIEDTEMKADLLENSVIVTASGGTFSKNVINNCWLTTLDGSDGNWYKVAKYIDSTHIWIDNNYQGTDGTAIDVLIGQCPPYPEEYHEAAVYYACRNFFLIRKDLESASMYKQLFEDMFNKYRTVYGNKTTGGVINPQDRITQSAVDPFMGAIMR